MYERNWDGSCLVNLIYFALHFLFQIRYLLHCVDEFWWNIPFTETRLGGGVADNAVAMLLPLWLHLAALWSHAVWIRIVTSHNAWMGYEYSLSNLNRPRAIHKHNPHPSKQWGVCDKRTNQIDNIHCHQWQQNYYDNSNFSVMNCDSDRSQDVFDFNNASVSHTSNKYHEYKCWWITNKGHTR